MRILLSNTSGQMTQKFYFITQDYEPADLSINSDKFVLGNESHEMYQASIYFRIVMNISNVNVM